MSEGYLDGEIAQIVDQVAAEWRQFVPTLPLLPAECEQQIAEDAELRTATVA